MSDKELPVTEGGDEVVIPDAECCGMHETCEKDSLLAAVSKDVESRMFNSENYRFTFIRVNERGS